MKASTIILRGRKDEEIRIWKRPGERFTMQNESTVIEMGTSVNAANIIALNYFVGDPEWENLSEDAREMITKGLTEKFLNILELMR